MGLGNQKNNMQKRVCPCCNFLFLFFPFLCCCRVKKLLFFFFFGLLVQIKEGNCIHLGGLCFIFEFF